MVYATIPASVPDARARSTPVLGLLAHVDTSPAVSGTSVKPIIHKNYQGGDIALPGDPSQVLTVAQNPALADMIGDDIITTDGTTLLGSDDKAGVATIMTLVDTLLRNPQIPHGTIKIGFTADEEIGSGIEKFDVERFGAQVGYTVDGGELGEISDETWSARMATVTFKGKNTHPGTAKGVMVNSIYALGDFVGRMPKDMLPETTEDRVGFVHPYAGVADVEQSSIKVLLRDFELAGLDEKERVLREIAMETERHCSGRHGVGRREGELQEHERSAEDPPGADGKRARGGASRGPVAVHQTDPRRHRRVQAHVSRPAVPEHLHRRLQLSQQAGIQFAARTREDHGNAGPSRTIVPRGRQGLATRNRRRAAKPAAGLSKRLFVVLLGELQLTNRPVDRLHCCDSVAAEVVGRRFQFLACRLQLDDGAPKVRMRFERRGGERHRAGQAGRQQKHLHFLLSGQ